MTAHLREHMRDELRLWREDDERAARSFYERRRSISEAALEVAHTGHPVIAHAGATSWAGLITHIGQDMISIRSADGLDAHLRLDTIAIEVVASTTNTPAMLEINGPDTLLARLRQLSLSEANVALLSPHLTPQVAGRLAVAARDHIVLDNRDGRHWIAPLRVVAGVVVLVD